MGVGPIDDNPLVSFGGASGIPAFQTGQAPESGRADEKKSGQTDEKKVPDPNDERKIPRNVVIASGLHPVLEAMGKQKAMFLELQRLHRSEGKG